LTVKTRQQPPDACVRTRTNVTPAGAAFELGGRASSSAADEVQPWIETKITKQGNAGRRSPFIPDES
jgi:hypothetical protein